MKPIKLLIILFIVIFNNLCFSQFIHHYGFKVGAVAATQNWDVSSSVISNTSDIQTRWGADVGGFVEWFNSHPFSLLTEMHYIQKGFTTSSNFGAIKIHYLSIPILAKCTYPGTYFCPYIIVGGRMDLHLSTVPDVDKRGTYALCTGTDYGATVGVGIKLTSILLLSDIGAEFRYSPSFQNISETSLSTIKNTSTEILLVISF